VERTLLTHRTRCAMKRCIALHSATHQFFGNPENEFFMCRPNQQAIKTRPKRLCRLAASDLS
jgi:hypothetical protein